MFHTPIPVTPTKRKSPRKSPRHRSPPKIVLIDVPFVDSDEENEEHQQEQNDEVREQPEEDFCPLTPLVSSLSQIAEEEEASLEQCVDSSVLGCSSSNITTSSTTKEDEPPLHQQQQEQQAPKSQSHMKEFLKGGAALATLALCAVVVYCC